VSECRDAAISEAERNGWHVHPLRGKVPLLLEWQTKASCDPDVVAAMFNAHPGANAGLVPGLSGLVSFDADSDVAHAEADALGLLGMPTLCTITRQGHHYHFRRLSADRVPPMRLRDRQRVNGKTAALEVKCDGANLVIPPSIHASGHQYRYEDPEAPIADCPADVWNLLVTLATAEREAVVANESDAFEPAPSPASTDSVIAAFNAAHSVTEMLAEYGYKRRRGPRPRFLAPESTSGLAGVVILEDRAYSHHATDVLADGHAHDAFDLFRIFEHEGDLTAAVRAAAEVLGIGRRRSWESLLPRATIYR
jgi:hypothetical protein